MSFLSEIAATEYYIRSTLTGSVALSAAFTSNISQQPLPHGVALPAIAYELIHASPVNTLSGVRVFMRLQYKIMAVDACQTIIKLAEADSIILGLFGGGREARVNVSTPYGTIMAVEQIRGPHSLAYEDLAENRTVRRLGSTYNFEVKAV